jgi:hypothetical protein
MHNVYIMISSELDYCLYLLLVINLEASSMICAN